MTAGVLRLRRRASSDPPLGDEALASGASTGDPAAVAELFDRFCDPVARFLSRAIGPTADVEDLVQATFLEIARGTASFEGRSSARTWILGIATNVVRHHRRSLGRRRRLEEAVSVVERVRAQDVPADGVDTRRALEAAWDVLCAMPDERRMAFVLCELEGLSAREAARVLGASETAVWKRVSEARRAIRERAGGAT